MRRKIAEEIVQKEEEYVKRLEAISTVRSTEASD